jgi:predicted GNAT family acetyltransferase
VGALVVLRGTGGIYHAPGDRDALEILAEAVQDAVVRGRLALLSGHASQLDPLFPMVSVTANGRLDRCHFCTLRPGDLTLPEPKPGFHEPRLATGDDMERLIDFYQRGFYSLARLPSRAAWRNRLSEQLAFRTLYFIDDEQRQVISAAQSSAEGGTAAMLGGVATLDEYRGQGLSTLCVGALCRHLFDAGMETVSLFYLKDNVSAGRVYEKLGFQVAGEWLLVPMGLGILFGNL